MKSTETFVELTGTEYSEIDSKYTNVILDGWTSGIDLYTMNVCGPNGRCLALSGRIGKSVSCKIYKDRPDDCSSFEPGSKACLKARKIYGIQR